MSKPDPPTPPNPIATAAAQTGTNVSTAVANAFLNNVNQNTPDGSLSYDVTGNHAWTDPSTGQTYKIPTFTATQTLSPTGQQLKEPERPDQTQPGRHGQAAVGPRSPSCCRHRSIRPARRPAGNAQNILNVGHGRDLVRPWRPDPDHVRRRRRHHAQLRPADNFSPIGSASKIA